MLEGSGPSSKISDAAADAAADDDDALCFLATLKLFALICTCISRPFISDGHWTRISTSAAPSPTGFQLTTLDAFKSAADSILLLLPLRLRRHLLLLLAAPTVGVMLLVPLVFLLSCDPHLILRMRRCFCEEHLHIS